MAAHQLHAETDSQGNQEYENRDLQGVEKSRFDDAAVLTVAVFGFTQTAPSTIFSPRIRRIVLAATDSEIKMGSISSEVERKIASSVPADITPPE